MHRVSGTAKLTNRDGSLDETSARVVYGNWCRSSSPSSLDSKNSSGTENRNVIMSTTVFMSSTQMEMPIVELEKRAALGTAYIKSKKRK